jgi:hypothetical protein
MNRRAKGLELMSFFFNNPFDHIWLSKMLLTLKILDFENLALTKVVHIYVIEVMNA